MVMALLQNISVSSFALTIWVFMHMILCFFPFDQVITSQFFRRLH